MVSCGIKLRRKCAGTRFSWETR